MAERWSEPEQRPALGHETRDIDQVLEGWRHNERLTHQCEVCGKWFTDRKFKGHRHTAQRRGNQMAQRWSNDAIVALKRLWADGRSASEIAGLMGHGFTRNAVIGKAHRLGLEARPSPIKGR